jgi:hypothetical protein
MKEEKPTPLNFEEWLRREDYGDVEQLRRAWEAGARRERHSLTSEFADCIGKAEQVAALINVCERVVLAAESLGGYIGRNGQLIKDVRAAIAKAEGKE